MREYMYTRKTKSRSAAFTRDIATLTFTECFARGTDTSVASQLRRDSYIRYRTELDRGYMFELWSRWHISSYIWEKVWQFYCIRRKIICVQSVPIHMKDNLFC